MSDTLLIEEMTWPQVKAAIVNGKDTAILACGAIEQHGPHLPTGTDTYLGTAIALRAAEIAGNALVAPTLRPGLSEHHMHFPGSFTVSPETFVAMLRDYCKSLARQGFKRVIVFASHGGNADMMRAHIPEIARALNDQCEVRLSEGGPGETNKMVELARSHDVARGQAGAHAGFVETSMGLAAFPSLVDMSNAEAGRSDDAFFEPENIRTSQLESFLHGIQSQAPNGVLGDPDGSSAQVGSQLIEIAATALASDLTVK